MLTDRLNEWMAVFFAVYVLFLSLRKAVRV